MTKYGLNGKLVASEGKAEQLAQILIKASELMANAKGCHLYVVGIDKTDKNTVCITEVWDTKEDHDNSLNISGVRELIQQAMPLLEGMPEKGQEIEILGGIGIQ